MSDPCPLSDGSINQIHTHTQVVGMVVNDKTDDSMCNPKSPGRSHFSDPAPGNHIRSWL